MTARDGLNRTRLKQKKPNGHKPTTTGLITMQFKNLKIYSFIKQAPAADELEAKLTLKPFKHCAAMAAQSAGWVAPLGRYGSMMTHQIAGYTMLCLKTQTKVLPAACVREKLQTRIDEIEAKEDRKIRGKEKTDLKDEVVFDMLPRAFPKSALLYGYIDHAQGLLIINTNSKPRAEEFTVQLRDALGTLPAHPLTTEINPSNVMTEWVRMGKAADKFTLGEACSMQSMEELGTAGHGHQP